MFNYSIGQKAGRLNSNGRYKKSTTLKLKQMLYNKMETGKNMTNIEKIYKLINLPSIEQYKSTKYYVDNEQIERYIKYLSIPENLEKNNIFLKYIYSNKYDKEYISNLIFMIFIRESTFGKYYYEYDNQYNSDLHNIIHEYEYFYESKELEKKLKEIVEYYQSTDISFSIYLKSIHCLIKIIKLYSNIYYDSGFTTFDKYALENIITDEKKQQLESEAKNEGFYNDEDEELERLGSIILEYSDKYKDLYEQCFYTQDWNLNDLSRIIYYIDKYDLDVFTTLNRLAADWSWSMYKLPKAQPGIQSTSIMIISNVGYDYDSKNDRTADVQKIVDEIYSIKTNTYLEDFNRSSEVLINLFKRTVEKHLVWGTQIF